MNICLTKYKFNVALKLQNALMTSTHDWLLKVFTCSCDWIPGMIEFEDPFWTVCWMAWWYSNMSYFYDSMLQVLFSEKHNIILALHSCIRLYVICDLRTKWSQVVVYLFIFVNFKRKKCMCILYSHMKSFFQSRLDFLVIIMPRGLLIKNKPSTWKAYVIIF